MFRCTSSRMGIFSTSRLPIRMEALKQMGTQSGQTVRVQRVHIRSPRFRWRPLVMYVLTAYVGITIYGRLVLDPLDRALEQEMKDMPAEDLEEDKPLFIPFPGTTKELKPKPYRGSDPEWQEFLKFSHDKPLQDKVRDELAQFVRGVASKNPVIAMRCGKDVKVRRCWLDVDFPTHPPPDFERSGIEISDDAISWVTMPVDSLTVFKIRQVLWPSALVKSFWNFTKVLFVEDSKRVAGMLGIHTQNPQLQSIDQLLARQQQMVKRIPNKDGPGQVNGAVGDAQKSIMKVPTPVTAGSQGNHPESEQLGVNEKMAIAIRQRLFAPVLAFRSKLQQTWRPAPNYPPRGSILVSGMVELESNKAYLVFDVSAAWDPKAKGYDPRSMQLRLRRFQAKQQAPRGGR